ncbi:MAG: hypothetical protein JXR73_20785 [Candidatus Omnitrophica bacterium]|nr:hypothetical protein [Candidatus Omnitrophota bacterium]
MLFDADDSNESGSGTRGFEGQYVLTSNVIHRDLKANDSVINEDWVGAASLTNTGYQVEFKILKANLSDPADGAASGFDICINDDDGSNRKAQLNWSGRPHHEVAYGFLTLAAGSTSAAE